MEMFLWQVHAKILHFGVIKYSMFLLQGLMVLRRKWIMLVGGSPRCGSGIAKDFCGLGQKKKNVLFPETRQTLPFCPQFKIFFATICIQ